jgi:nucleotidyltransferase substrate binding protein (TIGR01987 family)
MNASVSITQLEKAAATLAEAIHFADKTKSNEVEFKIARDACIQRFEYCIELAWKISLRKLGSQTKFAKPAVREMARGDLIASAEIWLKFLDARNQTSHSYDEKTAQLLFTSIREFDVELKTLIQKLKQLP